MKIRFVHQTLEDRGDTKIGEELEPGYCSNPNAWLCPGYYFWDASIDTAKWWGEERYLSKGKGYIICRTSYDYSSEGFFDLVGDTVHINDFWEAVDVAYEEYPDKPITVALVLGLLREDSEFSNKFKAVRTYPIKSRRPISTIQFIPKNYAYIEKDPPIQLCIWEDLSILKSPFTLIHVEKGGYTYKWK